MLYFGDRCLIRLLSSASASDTLSVTMKDSAWTSSRSASVFGSAPRAPK
jgi:hypothetical protein